MRTVISRGRRLIALTLSIVLILGMFPAGVVAVEETTAYGTVESLSDGVTIAGSGAEVKATYAGKLDWAAKNETVGRNTDGWWAGIMVTAPQSMDLEKAKLTSGDAVMSFNEFKDSADDAETHYIQLWKSITAEELRAANLAGGHAAHTYTFDWDGDGKFEQTVVLEFDAANTVLADENGQTVYPATSVGYGHLDMLTTGVTVSGNDTAKVTASYDSEITLTWVAADDSVGRYQDGWWAGMKITVPEGMTEEQLKSAQFMGGTTLRSFWEYKDSKEGDAVHYLTMWVSLNNLLSGKMDPFTYKFDWNNDGIFEQSVVMSVDASKVILMKDGIQMFPILGQISSYNGGSVVGSGTGDVTVMIDNAVLNWVPANEEIGRKQGWWVGIKVDAPVDMTVKELQESVFQIKYTPDAQWSTDRSFWNSKDSKDDDTAHNIQLWFSVSPADLEQYKAAKQNITRQYQFDWDNDGTYEQKITFSVDPNGNIKLNKVDQTNFGFEVMAPENLWVGDVTYQNVAIGGQGEGAITYEIIEGDAATIDAATGVLTFSMAGTVTVRATKAADSEGYYHAATAEYTVTAVRNDQTPKFAISQPSAITFDPGMTFANEITEMLGGTVKYEIVEGDAATIDEETGVLSIVKAGTVTVKATITGDVKYNDTEATYTLVINKANQDDFAFEQAPAELTWQAAALGVLPLVNGRGEGAVAWTIVSGEDVASVDADGRITLLKAGVFTIQAQKLGDDCYNDSAAITATILVNKAEQSGFGFGETEKVTLTYNDNGNQYKLPATGGQSAADTVYTVIAGDAAVVGIDGTVTLAKAGTVIIQATKPADERYNAISDAYELTIEPDTQKFTFEHGDEINIVYGTAVYTNAVVFDGEYSANSTLTYTLSENDIGATIDAATGKISFANSLAKVGTLTVTATKAADDCYVEYSDSYTVIVSYHVPSAQPVVSGDRRNDSDWFTGVATIAAPEGYEISYSNNLTGNVWNDTVTVSTDGDNAKNVYLKKGEEISDAISFDSIKIDTAAPFDIGINYEKPFLESVLETISFGIYQTDKVNVTISASDLTSGIDTFTYNIGEGDIVVNQSEFTSNEDGTASYKFTIDVQHRNKITVQATDTAGWTSEWTESDHLLVIDTVTPELNVEYEFAGSQNMGDTIYSNDAVTVKLEIKEDNFDLRTSDPVFKVGSMRVALTWEYDEQEMVWKAEQPLSGDNTYDLSLTFTDASGNVMTEYQKKIIIDSEAPVISSSYGSVDPVVENIFNIPRTAIFTITESNFNSENVVMTVTAKDITGADVDISSKDYAAYVQNPDNWITRGNNHIIELPAFDISAIYTVDIAYADEAKNDAADYETDEFIFDDRGVESLDVAYSTPVVEEILDFITFGFYKKDVVITVSAEDTVSGVDYFVITYVCDDGANNSNQPSYTTERIEAVQDPKNPARFTATHTLAANARGTITVQAYDMAEHGTGMDDDYVIVADTLAPGLEYAYTFTNNQVKEYRNVYYTQGETKVKFTIEEANFDLSMKQGQSEDSASAPVLTINGETQDVVWTQIEDTDKWDTEITLTGNGDYVVKLVYKDRSTNAMKTYTKEIHIDNETPVFEVTFDENDARNENKYNVDRTAIVKVTEHNFRPGAVKLNVTAKDITGAPVDISAKNYAANAKDPANWTQDGDVWTLNTDAMKFDIDAIYTVKLSYTDLAQNVADIYTTQFVIDKTAADNIQIDYSTSVVDKVLEMMTFGFYQADMTVTVTAEDKTAGVEYFEIIYTQEDGANSTNRESYKTAQLKAVQNRNDKAVFTASHTISAEARGKVSVMVVDKAGNESVKADDKVLVVDTLAPGLDVKYFFDGDQVREYEDIFYTQGETKVQFTIDEANFDLSLKTAEDEDAAPAPVLTVNGVARKTAWRQIEGTNEWVGETILTGNGDYVVGLSYTDRSGNEMQSFSKEIRIDNVAPVFEVSYDNNDAGNDNYYKADRVATVQVTERNFKPDEVKLTVSAEDIAGAPVNVSSKAYADYAKDPANWTRDGDVWMLDARGMVFDIDAIYNVKLEYTDLAENTADVYEIGFVIDKTSPSDVTIEYSTPIMDKVIEFVTFGFYQGDVVVTVTAKDQIAGVEYFEITYTQADGTDQSNEATYTTEKLEAVQDLNDKTLFAATHIITAEARGTVSVDLMDKAGNASAKEDKHVVVADTIAPGLEYAYTFTNDQVREYDGVFYTQGEAKVKFTIEEANFDLSLMAAADEVAAPAPVLTVNGAVQVINWYQIDETDKWETEITLAGNGDYMVALSYTDRSTNAMETYTQEIRIDSEAPVFSVTYSDNDARNENNYKADRTAIVQVTEHNFKPGEVKLTVTAEDITGAPVDISSKGYAEYVKDPVNWTQKGDVWTLDTFGMAFDIDAIYNVKLEYTDLAENTADVYETEFVIDKTIPSDVTIEYSTSLMKKFLGAVSFGFYQGDVTVTVTAKDQTAGVEYFQIAYTQVDGANHSNQDTYTTEKLEAVQDLNDKSLFTATHTITAEARGKVSVYLMDQAGNTASKADEYVVVADTIVPGLEYAYTFTDDLVREYNDIFYTQGETKVKFTIEEANFDLSLKAAEDESVAPAPVLTVNRVEQEVTWTQIKGTDKWETEITLAGNGDYVIGLSYTDRSTNAMAAYTKEVHIDDESPVFGVSYNNNEARNQNYYKSNRTATVQVTEHNFKPDEVKLTVTAEDITGAPVDISSKAYANYAKDPANWKQKGDVWTLSTKGMKFDIDAIYTVKLEYTDLAENVADVYSTEFVIDKTDAGSIKIDYSTSVVDKVLEAVTFGFYQGDVIVTVTAQDQTAGVEYFEIVYTQVNGANTTNQASYKTEKLAAVQDLDDKTLFTATHTIAAEARGKVAVTVMDMAGNESGKSDDKILVADTIAPGLDVKYIFTGDQVREYEGIYYTQGTTKIQFTVDEANFDLALKTAGDESASKAPVITVNDTAQTVNWAQIKGTNKWLGEIVLRGNGDYVVAMTFADRSGNEMQRYSQEIHIDNAAPVFMVTYNNNEARNSNKYKADRTATVQVTEHNFKPDEVKLIVTAEDITGAPVDISSKAYADYAKNADNWSKRGDVWTLNTDGMVFDIDGIYTVMLAYTGLAENAAAVYKDEFVIDKTDADHIRIDYSTSLVDKVLEAVSFGFYQADVVVTVTAEDQTAGVEYFEITYTQVDGGNNSNKATYTTEKLAAVQNAKDKTVFTASHTITAQARGKVSVAVMDQAGNDSTKADDKILVADTIVPGLEVQYAFTGDQVREYEGIFYTQGETKVQFTVDEANFDLALKTAGDESASKTPAATVNGAAQQVTWRQIDGTNKWLGEIVLTENGDYVVDLTFADRSGNEMQKFSKEIHIDNAAPVFKVDFDNNDARNTNKYKADRTATVQMTEHNFKPDEVKLTVSAEDITGVPVDISSKAYADYARNPANWQQRGDVWTLNTDGMKFDLDAIYSVKLEYTDLNENAAEVYETAFVIDKTVADNIKIEYSTSVIEKLLEAVTFGIYQADVTVNLTAEDMTAGVEYFEVTYTRLDGVSDTNRATYTEVPLAAVQDSANRNVFTASYRIPAQARGTVSAVVMDQAGNVSAGSNPIILVVDDVAPTREVIYTPYKILDKETMLEVDQYKEGDSAILYYQDKAVITFKINEANFDLSLLDEATKPVIKVNNTPVSVDWTQEGDIWTAVHTIIGDGDYVVTMTYTDLSTNSMVDYESCRIAIDGTKPDVTVNYADGTPTQIIEEMKYYKTTQTVAIEITDHNFRADDVELTVTAHNVQGKPVDISSKAYAAYAKNRANWISNGDVHTLDTAGMIFDIDAVYTFGIVYDDICDNFAADYAEDSFVVDHAAPTDLQIAYSTPIIGKVIEALTFGFYQSEVTVTLTADDETAGVDFFDWTYTKQADTSDKNAADYGGKITTEEIAYSNDGKTATATFTIPANARGYVSATVTDRSGNAAELADNGIISVVDNIAPNVSVVYEADSADTKVQFVNAEKLTVDSYELAANAFYNGDVTAKILIDEANFFEGVLAADGVIHRVGIKLTKTDDEGNQTVIEYLPEGAVQKYEDAQPEYIAWTTEGDVHTVAIPYTDNADYVLEVEYTDLSTNDSIISATDGQTGVKNYVSKVVTVDKIAPVIVVEYLNTEVINTIDGREYLNKPQSAVITVQEHNFRAADMRAGVNAVNFVNANVAVADFAAQLADEDNWIHDGNVHVATVEYTVDANYTFDFNFADLAQNASEDYEADLFTIDTTAPTNLTVSYSTNVFQEILESITFGYYNAAMTVIITADDATTGIHHFAYSYINSENVSHVNAELLDQAIEAAEIRHENGTSITSFSIPKMVLGNDNQFNGTVEFTAYDRSENFTGMEDTTRIVVDNISPTATITYNNPVQNSNGSSYYNGNINATIAITEANFDAADTVVTVTRNDVRYPVRVSWRDNSVDSHVGTFTLTEDGDYIVSVQYADKSGNKMSSYTSNKLVLDTTAPTIKVSNIKANSANKDEKYGFVIEFDDINLNASTIKSALKVVKQTAEGVYETVDLDLGNLRTVVAGQTCTYTIDNLPDDGLYALVCEVKDMSANGMSRIVLDDGHAYDRVQFSVNRDGSAFGYGNAFTEKLAEQYYIYSVDEDVVIVEVNVDPIEEYKVSLNGKTLAEGADYTTVQTSADGEWSKRTYTIKKDVFKAEGEYSIVVSSVDKAETTAYSDVKNLSMAFVVDQTKPSIIITGLESDGRYQTEEQTVTMIPTDEGGRLNNLTVIVLDAEGNKSVRFEMSGEELLKYLQDNDGQITFTIPEGMGSQVQIICDDCAVNGEAKTNEYNELFHNVTVSPNQLVLFYANKRAFYGTIFGVLALGAIIVILLKRKKNKSET